MKHVIVVGGGASGMAAAIAAGRAGHKVTLLEKNEKLGKKIYITGKGRCNFTNGAPIEDFFPMVMSNRKFLYSAFYTLTNQDVMDFMEAHGTPWKEERGQRIFPVSDRASDVTHALKTALDEYRVKVCLHTEVRGLLMEEDRVCGVVTQEGKIRSDAVILCTGGLSYPTTGSTGDGHHFAKQLGLKVTDLRPALVPFTCKESYIPKMQGLSLKNVTLSLYLEGKKKPVYRDFGEMMFTHFGITGPLVLSASSQVGKYVAAGSGILNGTIDLKPALDHEKLDQKLLRIIEEMPNKQFSNFYDKLLPKVMIPVMLELTGIPLDLKLNSITKEMREKILTLLKAFPLTVTGTRGFKEAIVTQGGISVKEIDPSTMAVKRFPGLFAAGELLDLDALTGGFNLQIAFSTGDLAGRSIE
ncbi:MAG: NAD(P)/FAD-dependent oxidoreductase [Lachnospiraceae bacterium]|nr:NAD(P)/FAD-dependent oxidoreductase [Lachnospiraceae bacterium]